MLISLLSAFLAPPGPVSIRSPSYLFFTFIQACIILPILSLTLTTSLSHSLFHSKRTPQHSVFPLAYPLILSLLHLHPSLITSPSHSHFHRNKTRVLPVTNLFSPHILLTNSISIPSLFHPINSASPSPLSLYRMPLVSRPIPSSHRPPFLPPSHLVSFSHTQASKPTPSTYFPSFNSPSCVTSSTLTLIQYLLPSLRHCPFTSSF